MAQRPTGVTILAILIIPNGILGLIDAPNNLALYPAGSGSILIMLDLAYIIVGIALLLMKPWARITAIALQAIGTIVEIGLTLWLNTLVPGLTASLIMILIVGITISLIVIIYLMQGSVKAAFDNPDAADL